MGVDIGISFTPEEVLLVSTLEWTGLACLLVYTSIYFLVNIYIYIYMLAYIYSIYWYTVYADTLA